MKRAELSGVVRQLRPRVWAITALGHSPMQTIRAGTLVATGAAAAQASAAYIHGWMRASFAGPTVWVPAEWKKSLNDVATIRASKIDPTLDLLTIDGVCALNRAATLCLLGTTESRAVVERCLDEFLRDNTEGWLLSTLDRLKANRPSGPSVLQSVLDDPKRTSGVTDSWIERVVAQLATRSWMPPLTLQHPVEVDGRIYRIDLACPALKLGIEAHSRSFHFGKGKEDADNVRDLHIAAQGWELLYVTYSQLFNPDELVRQFTAVAQSRAELLGILLPFAA